MPLPPNLNKIGFWGILAKYAFFSIARLQLNLLGFIIVRSAGQVSHPLFVTARFQSRPNDFQSSPPSKSRLYRRYGGFPSTQHAQPDLPSCFVNLFLHLWTGLQRHGS